MGQTQPPKPVKLIVGMLSQKAELFEPAWQGMQDLWGPVDLRSEVFPFDQTEYYQKQMGSDLLRQFVSFQDLIDPGQLAAVKHQSNQLEQRYCQSSPGKLLGVARPINLDPGYIDSGKLVLATTKNYSHRIYIGDSMYAESTLHYYKGDWQPWPYTYPDYADGTYFAFFHQVRKILMEQLSLLNPAT